MFVRYSSHRIGDGLSHWNDTEIYSLRWQTKYSGGTKKRSQYRLIEAKLKGEIWKWVMRLSCDVRRSVVLNNGWRVRRNYLFRFSIYAAYAYSACWLNRLQHRALDRVSQCIVFCVYANGLHKYADTSTEYWNDPRSGKQMNIGWRGSETSSK